MNEGEKDLRKNFPILCCGISYDESKLVWFGFMALSTIVDYLMPILFIHIYQIYTIWFGWVLWHINHCRLFNAKSSLYIYIKYIWFVNIKSTKLNSFKYCYVSLTIQLNISHLFKHS